LLLAVLTYSYLTGRVASEQVEEAMHFDAVLRRLHGDRRFEAAALRRFRRSTRGALSVCLFRTLRMAMRQPGARAVRDKWQVEDSTLLCACAAKAEQVLEAAVRADTLAMDV
jgi:hypothetical protein